MKRSTGITVPEPGARLRRAIGTVFPNAAPLRIPVQVTALLAVAAPVARSHGAGIRSRRLRHFHLHVAVGIRRSRPPGTQSKRTRHGSHRNRRAIPRKPQSGSRQVYARTLRLGDAAVTKMTTLNLSYSPPPRAPRGPAPEQWDEVRSVFPIYLALAKQLTIDIPFLRTSATCPRNPDADLFAKIQTWLDAMDQQVLVYQLRHLLQMTTLNASEAGLCALDPPSSAQACQVQHGPRQDRLPPSPVLRVVRSREDLSQADRARRRRASHEAGLGRSQHYAHRLVRAAGENDLALRGFRSLRDMLKTNFIEQGRKVKRNRRKNFLRAFLTARFHPFQLSPSSYADRIDARRPDRHSFRIEPVRLRGASTSWTAINSASPRRNPLLRSVRSPTSGNSPFQQEYTERSVNETFEKLLALRSMWSELDVLPRNQRKTARPAQRRPLAANPLRTPPRGLRRIPRANGSARRNGFRILPEQIWEQLIAEPPTRGRSMTTVRIGSARF